MSVKISFHLLTAVLGIALAVPAFAHGDVKGQEKAMHHQDKKDSQDDQATALGQPGDPTKVSRIVEIEMNDAMRFKPESISVKRGETIKFVAKNVGKVKHEMVLGTIQELQEHAEQMRKFPEMEHDDPNQVVVEPGKTGEMVWQFTKAGVFDFACLQPGHFEAGMKGKVAVKK